MILVLALLIGVLFIMQGLLGIVAIVVIGAIAIYNGLVRSKQQTTNAWAQIDVQLKRRHDLIPNLVETVKGYAAHERKTLEAVIQARNMAIAATSRTLLPPILNTVNFPTWSARGKVSRSCAKFRNNRKWAHHVVILVFDDVAVMNASLRCTKVSVDNVRRNRTLRAQSNACLPLVSE